MIAIQMPVFVSFFLIIRRMCEADPSTAIRESLAAGGFDHPLYQQLQLPMYITGPDPTFILPIATSISMGLLFKFGYAARFSTGFCTRGCY
jgi:hypothetical protein